MSFWSIVLLLFVSAIVGGIAQTIVGVSRRGCMVSIVIGLVGALLGNLLAKWANLPDIVSLPIGNESFPLIWSVVGAVIFVAAVTLLTGKRK